MRGGGGSTTGDRPVWGVRASRLVRSRFSGRPPRRLTPHTACVGGASESSIPRLGAASGARDQIRRKIQDKLKFSGFEGFIDRRSGWAGLLGGAGSRPPATLSWRLWARCPAVSVRPSSPAPSSPPACRFAARQPVGAARGEVAQLVFARLAAHRGIMGGRVFVFALDGRLTAIAAPLARPRPRPHNPPQRPRSSAG